MLVDGQIDHSTGLFMLRESSAALPVWCTDDVHADLTHGNPIFAVLAHYCGVERRSMTPDGREFTVDAVPGVSWRALRRREQARALFTASRPPPWRGITWRS